MLIGERYRLEREVGRGGMGAVWQAHDVVLERTVALKRVGLMPGSDAADLDRVVREARVSAMLNHRNVVAVYDLVTEGEDHWLVMEHLESNNLARVVRERGPLSPDETAGLMVQAAMALAEAHGAGIVHRDVKPSNMLVTPDGRLKLGDFGIARTGNDPSLTRTGTVTGSPGYLSPEVAAGQGATEASDMWSFGASIFHAVTGHPPYDTSENLMGALYRIVHEEPVRTDRAGWLDPLLRATMHADPGERWTARQAISFLRRGPGHHSSPAAPAEGRPSGPAGDPPPAQTTTSLPAADSTSTPGPHAKRRRRLTPLLAVLAVALVAGLTYGAWLLGSGGDSSERADPAPGGPSSGSPSAPSSTPSPSPTPSEGEMTTFAEDYISTVTSDPEAAFARLTPDYQSASGGYEGYIGFWGDVEDASISNVVADMDAMTVSYDFDYSYPGQGQVHERVTLDLVFQDGAYLISNASSG